MEGDGLQDTLSKSGRGSKTHRLFMDSISSDEGPEAECLLTSQLQSVVVRSGGRRESLTAPPSPTDSRKKRDQNHRQHNYMNHLHHLIHWRDIWNGEPHKAHEV